MAEENNSKRTPIFTYGTLKRGFFNHTLMQDLIAQNDAVLVGGRFRTLQPFPLVCGPHGIPYLINLPGSGHRVKGELYSVSSRGLARLDDLEGTAIGHYERLPIRVVVEVAGQENGVVSTNHSDAEAKAEARAEAKAEAEAEAYFAHPSFGEALWEKNRREGLSEYSEKEGKRYVKRPDRPDEGRGILEDVKIFVASPSSPPTASQQAAVSGSG